MNHGWKPERWRTLALLSPRSSRREGRRVSISSRAPHRGGPLHRVLDAHVSAAAADVSIHRADDLFVRRIGRPREQRRAGHDLTRLAVAALGDVNLFPGALGGVIAVRG